MDKNSAIGLTLIAALLMLYFFWFSPKPKPLPEKVTADSVVQKKETVQPAAAVDTVAADSLLILKYGDMATFVKGHESITQVETEDLKISFSNKGGIIRELELKKFKTYHQQPLKLIDAASTTLRLLSDIQGKQTDLYSLFYDVTQQKAGDTTLVTFTLRLRDGATLTQVYHVPQKGYEIGYGIKTSGFEKNITSENLELEWIQLIRPTEKDLKDTRTNTTINYYSSSEGFDGLPERSTNTEKEIITTPLKWIAIKEKFFLAALITKKEFSKGEFECSTHVADSSVVKQATIKVSIPKKTVAGQEVNFKFYLGPNDYQVIGNVTEKFAKNVYLGWPPVYWINKFIIFPVFHFLTLFIGNFGIIIIILVILLKLVLAPLSYRSYLSMAKMKVLKPELDEIKEKHGDDMSKVQQEQLKLYQQVGVNPISGCIPVLLQMPILFAMFYLFPASIELRQQPFLWAEDLSTYDSLIQLPFTLPFDLGSHISLFTLLMTISTLIYTWQNNQLSSVQGPMKSMSYIMPIIFFFVFNTFSAGLTFYYLVSNLVTFAQQAIIRRSVDDEKIRVALEENRKRIASGNGKKSKFMTKLEEAMKASQEAKKGTDDKKKKNK